MATHGIVHVELSAQTLAAATQFYGDVFGWQIQLMPDANYALYETGAGPGGGFSPVDGETYKPGDVIVYIGTDDIPATLAKIEQAGGKTLVGKSEVPGFGWYAFFRDPSGNRMALWQATGESAGAAGATD